MNSLHLQTIVCAEAKPFKTLQCTRDIPTIIVLMPDDNDQIIIAHTVFIRENKHLNYPLADETNLGSTIYRNIENINQKVSPLLKIPLSHC